MPPSDFAHLIQSLEIEGRRYSFYDVAQLDGYDELPFSLRILLECVVRKSDLHPELKPDVWRDAVDRILNHRDSSDDESILFHPGRVLLQDFTGVPALVDMAALRDVVHSQGRDPATVDSKCPADLVVDHSVQVDFSQISQVTTAAKQKQQELYQQPKLVPSTIIVHPTFPPPATPIATPTCTCGQPGCYVPYSPYPVPTYFQYPASAVPPPPMFPAAPPAEPVVPDDNPGLPIQEDVCPFHQRMSHWAPMLRKNQETEFDRNRERFHFLKWVNSSFRNITVIPPGTGIMHQVNLEYLARVVTCQQGLLFPDSVVGTDTHTTMINGLGVLGWGVGTLDAEAVMFGHPLSMAIPEVVGCKIFGEIPRYTTSTDIVLMITKRLRQTGVTGKFVEFFGPGVSALSIADRTTIANMCPEYGALVGFFPTDEETLKYLAQTGRDQFQVKCTAEYLQRVKMFRRTGGQEPKFKEVIAIDLSQVQSSVSGPKRSKDKVHVDDIRHDFETSLHAPIGPKGFGIPREQRNLTFAVNIDGKVYDIGHGTVVMAAITSCTNISNPSVMLAAGLLAKKAVEAGLAVPKYVKTSLSPGSGVVTCYLQDSGVMPYLHMLGFEVVGYGCTSCIDNNSRLNPAIVDAINQGNLACCGVLSGNRNFEGRLNPDIKANYLASPLLVIAYAIAGRIDVDLDYDALGYDSTGQPIFLGDIWPTRDEIKEVERRFVTPAIFRQVYARVSYGNKQWCSMETPEEKTFPWDERSSFIQSPGYIQSVLEDERKPALRQMRCLIRLGDDVTSDHISPAGSIARNSPAADYLSSCGLAPREFNSYGSRRGNYQVMMRGTFANIRLKNSMVSKVGPYTVHLPSGVQTTIFDAAQRYKSDGVPLVIIGGKNFGRGTSRDWATKGPMLLGVRVILAVSFDQNFRSNLVKTGILPIQISEFNYGRFKGRELFSIEGLEEEEVEPRSRVTIQCRTDEKSAPNAFDGTLRLDNSYEVRLYMDGGVICQMIRSELKE